MNLFYEFPVEIQIVATFHLAVITFVKTTGHTGKVFYFSVVNIVLKKE